MTGRYDYRKVSIASKEFARKDINENPEQINAHIESLRKWVQSMPHLNCPTDSDFLLKFLRVAKFDHAKAQMRLDNFCTVRSVPRGFPSFMKLFDVDDPAVKYFMDQKFLLPLGKNEAQETILLMRFRVWDPDVIPYSDLMSFIYMGLNVFVMDEKTQIYGIKFIGDLEHISRRIVETISVPKDMRTAYKILQDSFPIRIKSIIFYNEPVIFEIAYKLLFLFMNEKIKSRSSRLSHDIRKAERQVPGLTRLLPKEYNGEGETIDEIAGRWNKTFRDFYKTDHVFAHLSVDESKRPPETIKYLTDFVDSEGDTLGKAGTFTKFEDTF